MKLEFKERIVCCLSIIVLLAVYAILSPHGMADASDNPGQETLSGPGWAISGERGARRSLPNKICATEDLIYLVYVREYVDVFDYSGAYQYTIYIWNDQDQNNITRGGLTARCIGDQFVVQSQKGTSIYLFHGTELVEKLTREQGKARGLDLGYCPEDIQMNHSREAIIRKEGEQWVEVFSLPEEVKANLPRFSLSKEVNDILGYGLLILIVAPFVLLPLWCVCVVLKDLWEWWRRKQG